MAGLQHNTLKIVLVRKTGSGKSTTANTILGRRAFDSKISAHAVTKGCQRAEQEWKGRNFFVMDTPGLFDTTCEEISRCILFSYPGHHAIILVLQLGHYTEEEQKMVTLIKALFGKAAMNHMIFLFTHKYDLGDQTLGVIMTLAGAENLQSIIQECGNSLSAFNNQQTTEKAEKEAQMQELVDLIEEMVRKNGGAHFSAAIQKDIREKLQCQVEALKIIYADQLEKDTKLVEEQCAEGKISKQEMEKKKNLIGEL